MEFKPNKEFWTIKEHIAHVMDCEIFGFTRYRKSIAQANSKVEGFDEEAFTSNLDYTEIDIESVLLIISCLNAITVKHLQSIMEKDWNAFSIDHPDRGKDSLESLIKRRISHTSTHLEYIKRNQNLFLEQRK